MELAGCLALAFVSFVIPIIIATTAPVQRSQETSKNAMRLATAATGVYVPPPPITVATFLLPDDLTNYQNFLRGQPINVSCKVVGIRGCAFLEEAYQVFLHVDP